MCAANVAVAIAENVAVIVAISVSVSVSIKHTLHYIYTPYIHQPCLLCNAVNTFNTPQQQQQQKQLQISALSHDSSRHSWVRFTV